METGGLVSITAMALFGVAVLNRILMVSYFNELHRLRMRDAVQRRIALHTFFEVVWFIFLLFESSYIRNACSVNGVTPWLSRIPCPIEQKQLSIR
jgi:hypothetical protein